MGRPFIYTPALFATHLVRRLTLWCYKKVVSLLADKPGRRNSISPPDGKRRRYTHAIETSFYMKIINVILYFLILFFYLVSCNSQEKKFASNNSISRAIDYDSIKRIDSMKWYYYMVNYSGDAYFYDSTKNDIVKLNPLECDVVLDKIKEIGKDSFKYIFSFAFNNLDFRTTKPFECVGLRSYNNVMSPIFNHVRMDYENNDDSIKHYMNNYDSSFRKFLINYKGRMSPWLKEEVIKRKISL